MELSPLLPTNDFVFKKIFTKDVKIIEDFLKTVLDLPPEEYRDLTVLDPNLDREFIEDKLGVLDVKIN
ncbi:MAG: Rpn family recombination-promoting nuclease/putative transposase, partial [Deltaproteobacteria bacterium]|nr:Rpn family recombination-promoting nuclease/putative transposase [Deltaproteobacteria bacterium]